MPATIETLDPGGPVGLASSPRIAQQRQPEAIARGRAQREEVVACGQAQFLGAGIGEEVLDAIETRGAPEVLEGALVRIIGDVGSHTCGGKLADGLGDAATALQLTEAEGYLRQLGLGQLTGAAEDDIGAEDAEALLRGEGEDIPELEGRALRAIGIGGKEALLVGRSRVGVEEAQALHEARTEGIVARTGSRSTARRVEMWLQPAQPIRAPSGERPATRQRPVVVVIGAVAGRASAREGADDEARAVKKRRARGACSRRARSPAMDVPVLAPPGTPTCPADIIVLDAERAVVGLIVALGAAGGMMDGEVRERGLLGTIPAREVGVVGGRDGEAGAVAGLRQALDAQEAHIRVLIVGHEARSAQRLLLGRTNIACTLGTLVAEEEDRRGGTRTYLRQIGHAVEAIDAVRRGQHVGRTVGAGIIDERCRGGLRPPDDDLQRAARLSPALGIGQHVGGAEQALDASLPAEVVERLAGVCRVEVIILGMPGAEAMVDGGDAEGELLPARRIALGEVVAQRQAGALQRT